MYRELLLIFFLVWIHSEGSYGNNMVNTNYNNHNSKQADLIIDGLKSIFTRSPYSKNYRQAKSVNYLKSEMQRVGNSLLSRIQYLLSYLGIFRSNNKLVSSVHKLINTEIRSATIKDEVLRQYLSLAYLIPLHSEITSRLHRHYRKNNYQSKGYAPSRLDLFENITDDSDYGWKWVKFITKLSDFLGNTMDCMISNENQWYDVKHALYDLTKRSLNHAKITVNRRLRKSVPDHPNTEGMVFTEFEALICQILVNDMKSDFKKCLQQIRAIDICKVNTHTSSFSDRSLAQVSRVLRKNLKGKPDCIVKKTNDTIMTVCTDGSKNNITESLILSFSKYNRKILHNSKSLKYLIDEVSEKMINDESVFNYFIDLAFFEPYNSYGYETYSSRQLRNNLSDLILRTISSVHTMNTKIGEKLIDVANDSKRTLSKNFRIMKCIDRLLMSLVNRTHNRPITGYPRYQKNAAEDDEGNPLKYHEKSIRELVVSMRSLSELNLRKSSTIFTLANTFLLATVFYECISILVTLMYSHTPIGYPGDHNHSDGHYGIPHMTTEQINIIEDNYGEYEQYAQPANRIHRRETGEQYDNYSSIPDFIYDDTENLDYSNFYDIIVKKYV